MLAAALSAGGPAGAGAAAGSHPSTPDESIAVSYTDLPPALNLTPYVSLDIPADPDVEFDSAFPHVAVLADGGAVAVSNETAYLVGADASVSSVTLETSVGFIAATAGPVVYGLATDADDLPEFVAVALAGPTAGQVVAREPLVDPSLYLELPLGAFGNAPDGVVDRSREVGAVMMEHVDVAGEPLSHRGFVEPWMISEDEVVVVSDGSEPAMEWPLSIERHPEWQPQFVGESPPAPTLGGGGVYWTYVGPPEPDIEFSSTMPVIAVLEPGGGGTWYTIPDDWLFVASDTGGTLFARRVGDRVELARLSDALAADTDTDTGPCPEYTDNYEYPLRLCNSGYAVRVVQFELSRRVAPELPIDGFYGPDTEAVVREFQSSAGLVVDGLVGPNTWRALVADLAVGVDADGSGVVDPDELAIPGSWPGFPSQSAPTECDAGSCSGWAVVLAAAPDVSHPVLAEAQAFAQNAGYTTVATGCDQGAADALDAPQSSVTVSVYLASEADARRAVELFGQQGVTAVAARLTTTCLD